MRKLCDESVVLPFQIIFNNILHTAVYADLWKIDDVTPILKKKDKQLVQNCRATSLFPVCSKLFEKLFCNQLYRYLNSNNIITKGSC